MQEFFRGWKRKLGIVTIVLACAFVGGWVRGLSLRDKLIINGKSGSVIVWFNNQFVSSTSGITAGLYENDDIAQRKSVFYEWSSLPILTADTVLEHRAEDAAFRNSPAWDEEGNWEWKFFGVLIFGAKGRILLYLPYWSIVLPLTLLSAWLLLSKP